MLEEVQMPIPLGHGVVGRMRPFDAGHSKAAADNKVDADGQRRDLTDLIMSKIGI